MPRLKRIRRLLCCCLSAVEDEALNTGEGEVHKLQAEIKEDTQVDENQDLKHDKKAGGESAKMGNEEKKAQEEQEEKEEQRVARLMEVRREKLIRAFKAEKVQKELEAVLLLESRVSLGTLLISERVSGTSTYAIWRGPLGVATQPRRQITALHEEDLGLALISKKPPNRTTVTADCHFLRIGTLSFMSILQGVAVNTVHVEDNGKPVLVLQRSSGQVLVPVAPEAPGSNNFLVKLGTPAKILQFVLCSLNATDDQISPLVYNFLLTHHLFMSPEELCSALLNLFHAEPSESSNTKEKVVALVLQWVALYGQLLMDNPAVVRFLEGCPINLDCPLDQFGQSLICYNFEKMKQPIRVKDKFLLKIFRPDHSFASVTAPLNASVEDVMAAMETSGDNVLVRMKSSGEREQLKMDAKIISSLHLNERIFVCPANQANMLTPLPEQLGPDRTTIYSLNNMSSKAIAAQLTSYDWQLFNAVHETELLYYVFGRKKFPRSPTANLERFICRFNEVAYWVATELCLCVEITRRAQLLKKFIKIAMILYQKQNISSFSAVMYGLTNSAVLRLHKTWKKIPKKIVKEFKTFEGMLDPFSNHKGLREVIAKLSPPYIPYLPLILKDLTFTHEAHKTFHNDLVNFEKMCMIAKILRPVKDCRTQPYLPIFPPDHEMFPDKCSWRQATYSDQSPSVDVANLHTYVRNLKVINDQRKLSQLSREIES